MEEQFVFELDESEKQQKNLQRQRPSDFDVQKNAFKNQPSQLKPYQKVPSMFDSKTSSARELPTLEEAEKKKKIMEYLKIVQNKISQMEIKVSDATNEAEVYKRRSSELEAQLNYYKTKSKELENSREKVTEKEKLMAMKYGIILSQNKELMNKLKQVKAENEEMKLQLREHSKKESISDIISNDLQSKALNMTTRNHKRDYSSPIIHKNMPTCHSSATLSNNCRDLDKMDRSTGKVMDKSSISDAASSGKNDLTGSKEATEEEEPPTEEQDLQALKKLIAIQQSSLNSLPDNQKHVVSGLISKLLEKEKSRMKGGE